MKPENKMKADTIGFIEILIEEVFAATQSPMIRTALKEIQSKLCLIELELANRNEIEHEDVV